MPTPPKFCIALVISAALSAPAAFAGGYAAPVEPGPVILPEAETVTPWGGGYVGGSIASVFGGDDEVGLETYAAGSPVRTNNGIADLPVSGANFGLRAGYRWQRGNWVFGPELAYEKSSAEHRAEAVIGSAYIESAIDSLLTLRMKTGYLARENTIVYGSLGVVRGDFEYSSNLRGVDSTNTYIQGPDQTVDYSKTGYTVGLGVERKLSERLSMTGEWNYNHFGRTDVLFGTTDAGAVTVATPSHHNISVGLNFGF